MNLKQRINDFVILSKVISNVLEGEYADIEEYMISESSYQELKERIESSYQYNAWFTPDSIKSALSGIVFMLEEEKLVKWMAKYPGLDTGSHIPQKVGIVMAGNIPLVGFHDFLCVLISDNEALCKLSSSDDRLWPSIIQLLTEINPEYKDRINVVSRLEGMDAIIATGSNNTSRYFDYYFGKYPNIIRKNRNAIAILKGDESEDELKRLASDVFTFFGLGCRNVSKIYMPKDMDLNKVIKAFYDHKDIVNHNKYANNYDYNKTVMLLNEEEILENGFLLFKRSNEIASPLATLFYDFYSDYDDLLLQLDDIKDNIQCIVGKDHIDFGKAQLPELSDYADDVDTLDFLQGLN